MTILVTGGAGYIGSHTCVELLAAGYDVAVVDNYSNSKPLALQRVQQLAGKALHAYDVDIRDTAGLTPVFRCHPVKAVMHFAGLKAVGESVEQPLRYYRNNVAGTLSLLEAMNEAGVHQLVFSSSCTVYGDPASLPITETAPTGGTTNPYGTSKFMVERILQDLCAAEPHWHVALLRYFNPVGAHPSGEIGEDPTGIPNNLMPFITQVAVGKRDCLRVFGGDWPTPDGTGVRDYIHVVDLAKGHLAALRALESIQGAQAYNLGTGRGTSVLELHAAVEAVCGKDVPYRIVERRPGDIAATWADPSRAREELGWEAELGVEAMAADAWRWQSRYPDGYGQ